MICPPIGKEEAGDVVNARFTWTPVLFARRSVGVMLNDTALGRLVKISPEGTPADAVVSEDVCTVMPVALPAVAAPIVTPLSVIMKAVAALMLADAIVMMIAVEI